jgi:hypothetical protein
LTYGAYSNHQMTIPMVLQAMARVEAQPSQRKAPPIANLPITLDCAGRRKTAIQPSRQYVDRDEGV